MKLWRTAPGLILVIDLLLLLLLNVVACRARLFDRQISDKLTEESDDTSGYSLPPKKENPVRMGPFGNLMARNGPNFDEDQEPDPNPRLVDSIISVDLLNFSSQMSTLITALGMLFRQCLLHLQRLFTWLTTGIDPEVVETEDKRSSVVMLSWLIGATGLIVFAVFLKWSFFGLRGSNNPGAKSQSGATTGGRLGRGASKKFVTFMRELTLPPGSKKTRVYPALPPEMVARATNDQSKMAARWVNHLLTRLLDPPNTKLISMLLSKWLVSLNSFMVSALHQDLPCTFEFKEIPAMSKPRLSKVMVTQRDSKILLTSNFSISILQFRVHFKTSNSNTDEFFIVVQDYKSVLRVDFDQGLLMTMQSIDPPEMEFVLPTEHQEVVAFDDEIVKATVVDAISYVTATLTADDFGHMEPFQTIKLLGPPPPGPDCPEPKTLELCQLKLTTSCYDVSKVYISFHISGKHQTFETWALNQELGDEATKEFLWNQTIAIPYMPNQDQLLVAQVYNEDTGVLLGHQDFRLQELSYPRDQSHVVALVTDRVGEDHQLEIHFHHDPEVDAKSESPVRKVFEKKKLVSPTGQVLESTRVTYKANKKSKAKQGQGQGQMAVPWAALSDLEKRKSFIKLASPARTTMIIRSVQVFPGAAVRTGSRNRQQLVEDINGQDFDDDDTSSENSDEVECDLLGWKGRLSKSWDSVKSDHLNVPQPQVPEDASSVSEMSAISSVSTRLSGQLGESILVLEVSELAGITRHYLVPKTLLKRKHQLRRKGLKLHVVNDHVFVAKHIRFSTPCAICSRKIVKRLGKQGYVCRDCNLVCHKNCHAKVEATCLKSSFSKMELLRGSTLL